MTKTQFLNVLREDLDGMVSQQIINENIAYYSSYFEEQMAQGRTEEEIYRELGNPSLTARTIIDATEGSDGEIYAEEVYTEDAGDSYYQQEERDYNPYGTYGNVRVVELKWYHKLLIVVAIIAVVALVLVVGITFLVYAGPFILIFLLIYLIKKNLFG